MLNIKKLLKNILRCCYVTGSSGNWTWKKYADGTYKAILCQDNGSTGTMTALANVGAYSAKVSFSLPNIIGSNAIKDISAVAIPASDVFMDIVATNCTQNSFDIRYLRFGSTASLSNIKLTISVEGTWGGV